LTMSRLNTNPIDRNVRGIIDSTASTAAIAVPNRIPR
jgi:hypothetical protein